MNRKQFLASLLAIPAIPVIAEKVGNPSRPTKDVELCRLPDGAFVEPTEVIYYNVDGFIELLEFNFQKPFSRGRDNDNVTCSDFAHYNGVSIMCNSHYIHEGGQLVLYRREYYHLGRLLKSQRFR